MRKLTIVRSASDRQSAPSPTRLAMQYLTRTGSMATRKDRNVERIAGCFMFRLISLILGAFAGRALAEPPEAIRFRDQILPLLSDRCFHCHGPDDKARKADLRLDQFEEAALLRRWIQEGARYEKHWAFETVRRPQVPVLDAEWIDWMKNPIDAFVAEGLIRAGRFHAPEAPTHVLARRAALDLTGLPPSVERAAALRADFQDSSIREKSWRDYVEEQLQSRHHGERLAMFWLDAARYSDTDGYQADATRTNWPWRDWVVEAFNRNQPYDEFTLEQFAGDLIPNASNEQKLATCFHRNHMANGEGGRLAEESRVDYVIDRVNTTGTVWLGLTMGCAQCHSHKFDPVTQVDYYKLAAFFNSIDETGAAGAAAKPVMEYESPHGKRAIASAQKLVDLRKSQESAARNRSNPAFQSWLREQRVAISPTYRAWHPLTASVFETNEGSTLNQDSSGIVTATGKAPAQDDYRVIGRPTINRVTGFKLEVIPHESLPAGGASRSETGYFILTDVKFQIRSKGASQYREVPIVAAKADYSPDPKKNGGYGNIANTFDDDPRNGWANFESPPSSPHTAVWAFAQPESLAPDEEVVVEIRQRALRPKHTLARFRLLLTDQPGPAPRDLEAAPLEKLAGLSGDAQAPIPEPLREKLMEQFLVDYGDYRAAKEELDRANAHLAEMKASAAKLNVMILQERKEPRPTHVLQRGQWDNPGPSVEQGVPESIAPWQDVRDPSSSAPTRADLARWLTSRSNPLTPRVTVNHLWQMLFGEGLVRTPDDFGLQGEMPTHPKLLDWLASELLESGWNLRHILRLILTSATYRQSSRVAPDLLAIDPTNRLLARGARFRMPSWMIRDQALALSALLNPELGGPPVRPYQPSGVWEDITMGRFKYTPSDGDDQYRRTLYAFWRRSASPSFLFDSAQRRVCEVRMARTNTPMQALTLMNDVGFLEAARHIAAHALKQAPLAPVPLIFQRVLLREPEPEEQRSLEDAFSTALTWYKARPDEARKAVACGQSPLPSTPTAETAAAALVANLILNLDETLTRE